MVEINAYSKASDGAKQLSTHFKVREFARTLMPDWGGVGVYKSFTHIDVREARADWTG